jgi:hypothetical protein
MAQKSRYDRFPATANGWGTKYPVPDTVPPLLVVEEGPPTLKERDPGMIHTDPLSHHGSYG